MLFSQNTEEEEKAQRKKKSIDNLLVNSHFNLPLIKETREFSLFLNRVRIRKLNLFSVVLHC